ncbi:MAG TPA: NADH-quinone oxidoreductase subunit NuoG [Ilumatobacteraceae bacterium]|nr:NADH-quinone oxidoreductase subunit NuoG [Ilumatobacteraceae bacterium]
MTTTESGTEPVATPVVPNEVRVTINGREVVSTKGELVIAAAQRAGDYIPRFCYHERMSSVGMCRMCLVDIDTGRGAALQPSCMVTVAPGMVVNTQSDAALGAQEGVIELLLANHPLDCPVCDKGGECPLQDQAFSHGPGESRYIEEKRHFEKPISISDLVLLDRERCILCDRCTRFADEVAGDALIHFSSRGNTTQITTFPDEPFASYFSGNTVQICPVGALTAKPYRFKARPWDLDQTESTCTTCSVGCRTMVQSSRDELLRYQGVDSDPVNWGWLCDRGRFNFEAVNSADRLSKPLVRVDDELQPATWNAALARAAELISEAKAAGGGSSIAVLGGARGTNEDAYAWARLVHDVIGTPHVYPQMADGAQINLLGFDRATIDEAANASTIILIGPDLKEELPVLYLRLRDAAQKRRSRIIEFAQKRSGLSAHAWKTFEYQAGGIAQAVAAAGADPDVAAQLGTGNVVIVAGRANLAEHPREVGNGVVAALQLAPEGKVLPALRRGNIVGAIEMGLVPGEGGMHATEIARAAASGKVECLVLLGCDPLADFPDTDLARQMIAGAPRIIAIDTFLTKSNSSADVVLAAAAYGEKSGTTSNIEGRVTTVSEKVTPRGTSRPDWMIAVELAELLGGDLGVSSVDDLTEAIAANVAGFAEATVAALGSARDGILCRGALPPATARPAAIDERNSYDYRLVVSRKLYDGAVGTAKSPSLAHLTMGSELRLHPLDIERVGSSEGADVKVTSKRASMVFKVVGDESVVRGSAWVPFNQPGPNIGELIDSSEPVTDVRVESF